MSALHKYNISVYGGVNENSIHRPTYLNVWIQVSGLYKKNLVVKLCWKNCLKGVRFDVSKIHTMINTIVSVFPVCRAQCHFSDSAPAPGLPFCHHATWLNDHGLIC